MTEVVDFNSPLVEEGAKFSLPPGSLGDLRRLTGASARAALAQDRSWMHVVLRLQAPGFEARRRVFDRQDRVEAAVRRPVDPSEAAQFGALLVYAVRSERPHGHRVSFELEAHPDAEGLWGSGAMNERSTTFARRMTGELRPERLISPACRSYGLTVSVPDHLTDLPRVVSQGYSLIYDVNEGVGQQVAADLVGAYDYTQAKVAFREAERARTPYAAAQLMLDQLG